MKVPGSWKHHFGYDLMRSMLGPRTVQRIPGARTPHFRRSHQNEVIANFLANDPELDVVVVGDFNMIPGQEDVNFDAMAPNGS